MILKTEHLLLREFNPGDFTAVFEYQNDSRYLRYYPWRVRTFSDVKNMVQSFIDQQHERPRTKFQLAIILKSKDRLIGNCGIRKGLLEDKEADIGYEISPTHWGLGYATEATRAILAFGFMELKLHRISATTFVENTASVSVLQKLGMRKEGRLRENRWMKGRWWDTLVYSILENEYGTNSE